MSEDNQDKLARLEAMSEPDQGKWDLSPNDVEAIRWALETLERHRVAVEHTLDQAQRDPKGLGYHVGRGMRTFELLCEAEAAYLGMKPAVVQKARAK